MCFCFCFFVSRNFVLIIARNSEPISWFQILISMEIEYKKCIEVFEFFLRLCALYLCIDCLPQPELH